MEDASVRAGLHHDAGPIETQRGNLTAGGRPGQVVPGAREQPFQPASPDTVHSKQMKVRACWSIRAPADTRMKATARMTNLDSSWPSAVQL